MPPLIEQRDLECPECDGVLFTAVTAIRRSAGGGTIYPPRGYLCIKCNQLVDVAGLLNKETVRQMEQELKEKQAQLQATRRSRQHSAASSTT